MNRASAQGGFPAHVALTSLSVACLPVGEQSPLAYQKPATEALHCWASQQEDLRLVASNNHTRTRHIIPQARNRHARSSAGSPLSDTVLRLRPEAGRLNGPRGWGDHGYAKDFVGRCDA